MKYMGSKSRIANEILPIILKNRKPNQYYVEPFCWGCNKNNIMDIDGSKSIVLPKKEDVEVQQKKKQ